MPERAGHGWWPYIGPFLVFMSLGEIGARLSGDMAALWLVVKPGGTAACLAYFWWRGAYPELRGYTWLSASTLADLGVGVLLAGVWMAPYVIFPSIRPEDVNGGFDPEMLGVALAPAVMALRFVAYAGVTPVFEELFMRSFVIRVAETWNSDRDFRNVPIGFFSWKSFLAVVVLFTITHLPWEWWVMVPWAVLSTLWLYRRKHVMAVIVLHGATNGAILVLAALFDNWLPNGSGGGLPLWFFV